MTSTLYLVGLMILRLALPLGLLLAVGSYLSRWGRTAGRGDFHGRDA